ncbi:MAG TPA: nickel-binding protein [Candidatus Dormibacteraeota bacterium]
MGLYLVERYVAGPPEERLAGISNRLRKAAGELQAEGADVRYLQSIVLHGEESCLCLFEARSAVEVRLVNERAGLAYLRIVGATAESG